MNHGRGPLPFVNESRKATAVDRTDPVELAERSPLAHLICRQAYQRTLVDRPIPASGNPALHMGPPNAARKTLSPAELAAETEHELRERPFRVMVTAWQGARRGGGR